MQSIEIPSLPSTPHEISSNHDTLDNVSRVLTIILQIILIIVIMKYLVENIFGNRIWTQFFRFAWRRYNLLGPRGPPPPQGPPPPPQGLRGPPPPPAQGPPPPPAQGQPIAAGPGQPPRQQPSRLARLNQMNQAQQQAGPSGFGRAVQHMNFELFPSSPPPLPPLPPRSPLPISNADQALPNEQPLSPSPWITRGHGFGGSGVCIDDEMTDDYDHIDISQNKSRLTVYHVNHDKVEYQNENVETKLSQHQSRRSATQVKSSQKRPGSFAEYR